jgi:hypothetical protein
MMKAFSGSASAINTDLFMVDSESNYDGITFSQVAVQLTGTFVATIEGQQSNDGVTWQSVQGWDPNATSPGTNSQKTTVGFMVYQFHGRYFRLRTVLYTSGTVNATAYASDKELVALNTNTTVSGTVWMSGQNTSMGGTTSRVKSAASTNATNLRTTAGNVYAFGFFNNAAATRYVKFYSKASAPTVGTDTPLFTVVLPAGGNTEFSSVVPLRFGAGIGYAITAGVADNDTTAVALDDVHGFIHWV